MDVKPTAIYYFYNTKRNLVGEKVFVVADIIVDHKTSSHARVRHLAQAILIAVK